MFDEEEVLRWRNRKLTENAKTIVHLPLYYQQIQMHKFCTYSEFKAKMEEIVFLINDDVIQYISRHNIWRDIQNVVGDIVSEYHNSKKPRCSLCGTLIYSYLGNALCPACKRGEVIVQDED